MSSNKTGTGVSIARDLGRGNRPTPALRATPPTEGISDERCTQPHAGSISSPFQGNSLIDEALRRGIKTPLRRVCSFSRFPIKRGTQPGRTMAACVPLAEDSNMTGTEAQKTTATVFGGVTPILRVQSLPTSIDYYVAALGFKVDWHEPGIMVCVSRDRCNLMLCAKEIREILEAGSGSASMTLRLSSQSIGRKERRCGIRRPTIRGPARCRLRILTDTCCGLDQSPRRISLSASGVTCMAAVGCFRLPTDGHGSSID